MKTTKKYQQGDVLIKSLFVPPRGKKLGHLILQKSDVSGHAHRVSSGVAALYATDKADEFVLKITSPTATISHEEHNDIVVPRGVYTVYGVKEYDPFEDLIRRVQD